LDQGNAKKRVEEIAEMEGVKLEDGASDALIKCSEGDLRKAITFLQSAARLVGAVKTKEDDEGAMDVDEDTKMVTVKIVEDIAGVIPGKTIGGLVKAMQPRSKGLVYEDVAKAVTDMIADGWSATQVIAQVCIHSLLRANLTTCSSINRSSTTKLSLTSRRTRLFFFSQSLTSALLMVLMSILQFSTWH
jgi:replication factor C subunit 2/4